MKYSTPQAVDTVGGLIQWQLERIPRVGDRVDWNDLSLEVVEMEGVRIDRILATLQKKSPTGD